MHIELHYLSLTFLRQQVHRQLNRPFFYDPWVQPFFDHCANFWSLFMKETYIT